MGKQLTREDFDYICQLHTDGMLQKDIADKVGKALSTICEIVKQNGRMKFKKNGAISITGKGVQCTEFEEVDLSTLPDSILFKHDHSFIF